MRTWCWRRRTAACRVFSCRAGCPTARRNGIYIQRLKDKLGNRSNASSEVEFIDAWAHLMGEEGRGIPTILEMGTYTRLDCVTGTAGMMRQAVVQAVHHARHRKVFGALLIHQPLMQSVLADLAIESEAATVLAMRLARAFDSDADDEVALRRALTSAAKFWVCKRGCELAAEAMEVLGGNGYTEEMPLARMAREMPVNSIWEGSGNIMCLDVLRAFGEIPGHARRRAARTGSGARACIAISMQRWSASPPPSTRPLRPRRMRAASRKCSSP